MKNNITLFALLMGLIVGTSAFADEAVTKGHPKKEHKYRRKHTVYTHVG